MLSFFLATEIILLEQWRRWVLLCLKRHVAPCSTNLWLGPSTPYRHSLLLKFLHISFFTYTEYMMIFLLFSGAPSPIFWQFLICNKICIKNKTSAATPKNCCVRILLFFFVPYLPLFFFCIFVQLVLFWEGQVMLLFFQFGYSLAPAHKDIYANCVPLGPRLSMRIWVALITCHSVRQPFCGKWEGWRVRLSWRIGKEVFSFGRNFFLTKIDFVIRKVFRNAF